MTEPHGESRTGHLPASKIQNEQEVVRWYEEGRTYQWMVDEYRRRYKIETTVAMFSNFRSRKNLDRRNIWDTDLIPWALNDEHRWHYAAMMLRLQARVNAGQELDQADADRLASWKAKLEEANAVVHYDPDTTEGFFYIPREPDDRDALVRRPKKNGQGRRGPAKS
jgi:hypothetical protein